MLDASIGLCYHQKLRLVRNYFLIRANLDFAPEQSKEKVMSKKTYVIVITLVTLALLLSACERPASIAPVTNPTSSGEIPFPVATQPQIMKDILSATQTAAAASGTLATGGLTEGATSTPAFTFVTPTSSGSTGDIIVLATSTSDIISLSTSTVYATSTPYPTETPTAIVWATSTPGIPSTYTLKKGEFVYCIARRFDVDPSALLSANGLGVNSVVSPGTKLTIPTGTSWPGDRSLKDHPTNYTVAYGDTFYTIACAFGDADPNVIMAANGLTKDSTLSVGQVLYIP